MDMNSVSIEPEKALREARNILKYDLIREKARKIDGPIVEIVSYPNGRPGGFMWLSGKAFVRGDAPLGFDVSDMETGQPWLSDVKMAIWLFGPSRVAEPHAVYRWLWKVMDEHAPFYMTTEIPWRGKLPLEGEYGQYSDEEIHAVLVRNGFEHIRHTNNGPYFRLWSCSKSANLHYQTFQRVERHLAQGDWQIAVEALGELDEHLDSMSAVREYALLLAACHDLAGNTRQGYVALSETLRIDSECARAMCGLGRLAALNDDLDGANVFFSAALNKSPCMVAALRGHAVVSEYLGDTETAYLDMMDASNFRPTDDDLLFEVIRLGNSCGKQDQVAEYLHERDLSMNTVTHRQYPAASMSEETSGEDYAAIS
ncbi:MAG: hypothetical protein JXX29_08405 [Deltaproteobacteria bacterium]|nr:hypothetical protein [Deltaproteobacteria bacterium]MBN2671682.1 hypothetical protein [Deltaproteobacteria bacterium]